MKPLVFAFASALRSALGFAVVWTVFSLGVADAQPMLQHVFKNPNPAVQDFFGRSVALEGDYVIIGASGDDTLASNAGKAFLYDAASGNLLHSFSDPNPAPMRGFGNAVAISNNFVVIGAPDHTFQTPGQAFVFDAVTGNLLHTLENPEPAPGEGFGWDVAIDGTDVLIGAYLDDSVVNNGGQAFMFNAATGALTRTIRNPAAAVNDLFGIELAIEGNTIAISASGDSTLASFAGQVSIFDRDTGALRRTLNNPVPGIFDRFGSSVGLSGDKVVVGEVRDETYGAAAGLAHVFDASTGVRLHTFHDPIPPTAYELFSVGTHISGDDVFIATDTNIQGLGKPIYVFHFDAVTGELLRTFDDPSQVNYFTSFGRSISKSGNRLLIGAPGDFSGISGPFGPGQVFLYDLSVPEPATMWILCMACSLWPRMPRCLMSKEK
jgi:WD40 repeat protein